MSTNTIQKHDLDITQKQSLIKVLGDSHFDFCINCAAYTNVEAAEENPNDAFLINATGAKNIAEVCNDFEIKLIHISTDYVFDGKKEVPYTIYDETNPINEYGKSKLQGEVYIRQILKDHFIIRTSWLYAVYGKNFVKSIINNLEKNKKLNITTEQTGTPTSCFDLAKFILHIIEQADIPFGTYNFSARGSTTWFGFAKKIAEYYDKEKIRNVIATTSFKTIAKRPQRSVLDIHKTENFYQTLKSWQESLREVLSKLPKNTDDF